MELKQFIKETIFNNFQIKENIDYVRKYIHDSEDIKAIAENWAKQINDSPETIKFNFSSDSIDFKKTSYMLEILIYAIASGNKFLLPTINKEINVNVNNIAKGIMMYMFPSYNYDKFAKFISGNGFTITGDELEYLDAEAPKMMDALQNILINVKNTISKYLNNEYYQKDNKSFVNYLQTALRYPLRDARKYLKKHGTSSIDEPIGDNRTRVNTMSDDDYDGNDNYENKDSFNDFNTQKVNPEDDDRYTPELSDKLAVILKLNNDIGNLITKKSLQDFFKLRIIGLNGNEKTFGDTMSYGDIKKAFKNNTLSDELKFDISKKLLSFADKFLIKGYDISKGGNEKIFIPGNIELLKQFKKEHPESFNSKGQLIASPALMDFLEINVKEDKLRPKTLFKRIRREIQDFFKDNKDRLNKLNQIVSDSGLINPETNEQFSGIEYLNSLLKARTEKKEPKFVPSDTKKQAVPITEDMIYEEITGENTSEEENSLSFTELLNIAKATVITDKIQLQEARKLIKNILKEKLVN